MDGRCGWPWSNFHTCGTLLHTAQPAALYTCHKRDMWMPTLLEIRGEAVPLYTEIKEGQGYRRHGQVIYVTQFRSAPKQLAWPPGLYFSANLL